MSQCQSTPTATLFGTFTTNSLSTSSTETVTTIPASVTTIEQTVCSTTSGVSGCSTLDVVSTISPAQVVTTQIPLVTTVPITQTSATATLFSTACSSDSNSSIPPSSDQSSTSAASSTSTLPPVTSLSVFSSSSTLPGGSVIIVLSTSTAVITPTTVVPVSSTGSSNGNGSNSSNLGGILAGVLGGAGGVALIMLVVWCMLRRRRKEIDDDFEEGYPPFPIKLRKPHEKVAGIDDPPIPFDPYGYGAVSASSPSEGVSGSFAGRPRAASVRRRNPTSSEGYPHSMPPIPLIPLSDDVYRRTTPPAVPTSVGSIPSGSGSSERLAVHRPLQVMNPTPTSGPPARDTKDPMIYLSANRGLEVRAGSSDPLQNASPSGPLASGSHSAAGDSTLHGSSYVPFVHRDGGSLPILNPPPRSRVVEGADTTRVPTDAPPPAYQE